MAVAHAISQANRIIRNWLLASADLIDGMPVSDVQADAFIQDNRQRIESDMRSLVRLYEDDGELDELMNAEDRDIREAFSDVLVLLIEAVRGVPDYASTVSDDENEKLRDDDEE